MKSPQKYIQTLDANNQKDRLAPIENIMQYHSDPDPVCYFPPQRTENDECLYEFQTFESKQAIKHQIQNEKQANKKNIELTLALSTQNDELTLKIKEVKDLLCSEELKASIFRKKYEDNQKVIAELKDKKEKLTHETSKIKTLNQSAIPNKSIQLNTTNNTNAWINEFLSKSQLESLWSKQKEKESKNSQSKIKSYTIDLSTFMNSARLNGQKINEKPRMNELKGQQQRLRMKGSTSKLLTTRPSNSKPNSKAELSQKQRLLNKNLSQLRNIKKTRINPQL